MLWLCIRARVGTRNGMEPDIEALVDQDRPAATRVVDRVVVV
jgi:hypothetical protein